VGAELFHTDGWTDMMTLIVAFRNFAKAPKNTRNERRHHDCLSRWFLI